MTKEELLAKIKQDGKDKIVTGGILGDMPGCYLFEENREITENGWETKYYGINYKFKGKIDNDIIDRATITKKAFMEILKANFPFYRKKKILESFAKIYKCEGGLMSRELKTKEFCPAVREILRASLKMIELKVEDGKGKFSEKNCLLNLAYCLAMFLQFSLSYLVRVQDILPEINKDNFQKRPLTETLRLKRIFMSREVAEKKKMGFLWQIVFLAVLFNRKLAKAIIKELDIEKIKMDEADRYFILRRGAYNFGGISLEERLKIAGEIDKRENNIIFGNIIL